MEDRWIKVSTASERLQVSVYTMQRMLRDGEIKGYKIGNRWRIKEKDLEAYMKRSEHVVSGRTLKIVGGRI